MLNTTGWDTDEELAHLRSELAKAHSEIARLRQLLPADGQPAAAHPRWLLGYGSLMWNAGSIPYVERRACFVRGFKRRFWQRSTDHRGTIAAPGRVVTLVRTGDDRDVVFGVGFAFAPDQAAAVEEYLDYREKDAYSKCRVPLWDARTGASITDSALVYVGFAEAHLDSSEDTGFIASEIAQRCGPSGTNTEYALLLQTALARAGLHDDHVYAVVMHLYHQ